MDQGGNNIEAGLIHSLRKATEAAACAAFDWIGRGDKESGDAAAVDAMRANLNTLPLCGRIIIGEGEKDEAAYLHPGERVGANNAEIEYDIAVDPIEGTSYLADGLDNSMSVLGAAPAGTILDPGAAFYMEKFAAPPAAKGLIDMAWPLERKLQTLAEILGKPSAQLTVFVLDKPRHVELVKQLHGVGVRVALHPAGDVAGALMAAIPGLGIDCLMGTGGTPEGITTACAIRAIGGEFIGRLDPQKPDERAAVEAAGLDTSRWYQLDEIVSSQDAMFCATGITPGPLFDGVQRTATHYRLQTLMACGATRERQLLTNYIPIAELS